MRLRAGYAFLTLMGLVSIGLGVYAMRGSDAPAPFVRRLEHNLAAVYNSRAEGKHAPYRVVKVHCRVFRSRLYFDCRAVILGPSGPSCSEILVRAKAGEGFGVLDARTLLVCPESQRAGEG